MVVVRTEQQSDHATVRAINLVAFPEADEADLVDALRLEATPTVSFVAEQGGTVVGHIMFSPVTLAGYPELKMMGLAPMAVTPDLQRGGIGSALVEAGIEACRRQNIAALIVLGHPAYYPRFGFIQASQFDVDSAYDVPDDTFMAMELYPGALDGKSGRANYHEVFDRL